MWRKLQATTVLQTPRLEIEKLVLSTLTRRQSARGKRKPLDDGGHQIDQHVMCYDYVFQIYKRDTIYIKIHSITYKAVYLNDKR